MSFIEVFVSFQVDVVEMTLRESKAKRVCTKAMTVRQSRIAFLIGLVSSPGDEIFTHQISVFSR